MDILMVTSSFYPATVYGGPIFSIKNLCASLTQSGHNVKVCSANPNGKTRLDQPLNKWLVTEDNYKVKFFHDTIIGRFSYTMMKQLGKEVQYCDVLHSQDIFSTTNIWAVYYAKKYNKPLIVSSRGKLSEWSLNQNNFWKKIWIDTFLKPNSDKLYFHATSKEEADEIALLFPSCKGIFTVPNIININDFSSNLQQDNEVNGRYIFSMGRYHVKKGFDILIKAFNLIKNDIPDLKLIIAGSDEGEKSKLKLLINQLQLQKKVILLDEVHGSEKAQLLSNAEMFALASHSENFGLVYAEALINGTPIIASIHTPWKEAEMAGCGFCVNNTEIDFADAILKIFKKGKSHFAQNAKKFAENFAPHSVAKKMIAAYEQMINFQKNSL